MAHIALTETDLTTKVPRAPSQKRSRRTAPAPWSPRRKLLFLLSSASGLWALIGIGVWSLL